MTSRDTHYTGCPFDELIEWRSGCRRRRRRPPKRIPLETFLRFGSKEKRAGRVVLTAATGGATEVMTTGIGGNDDGHHTTATIGQGEVRTDQDTQEEPWLEQPPPSRRRRNRSIYCPSSHLTSSAHTGSRPPPPRRTSRSPPCSNVTYVCWLLRASHERRRREGRGWACSTSWTRWRRLERVKG
jgi:hypothetical protein